MTKSGLQLNAHLSMHAFRNSSSLSSKKKLSCFRLQCPGDCMCSLEAFFSSINWALNARVSSARFTVSEHKADTITLLRAELRDSPAPRCSAYHKSRRNAYSK